MVPVMMVISDLVDIVFQRFININKIIRRLNTTNNVLKSVRDTNDEVRGNRDWEKMKGSTVS